MATAAAASRLPRAYVAALTSPHVIELLMPLYAQVPRPSPEEDVAIYAVSLAAAAEGSQLHLAFPELSRPDSKMFAVDVECVCGSVTDQSAPREPCRHAELLHQMLLLSEMRVLRVTAKYVVARVAAADTAHETDEGDSAWIATLQLFVALHERVMDSDMTSELHEFEFALSHLQAGLMASRCRRDGTRRMDTIANARRSGCHVVGCELHDSTVQATVPRRRFQLQEVFQQLMAHDRQEEAATATSTPKKPKLQLQLTDLTRPLLRACVGMLNSRDVARLSGVCTLLQHVTYEVVPGLNLLLFSHQKRALRWLLYREGSSRGLTNVPHPFVFPSISPVFSNSDESEDANVIDLIDGRLVDMETVTPATDTRGGLFCDEPGLGKTITMLALILRTKAQRSIPHDIRDENPQATRKRRVSRRLSAHGREVATQSLLPSAATLIIVPRLLLDHWRFQIATHITRRMLKVFIDDVDCKLDLPPAAKLASYDVVITSFDRLSAHWKYHKPKSASEMNRPTKYGFEDAQELFVDGFVNRGTSALLRVHWVRIVVDEGHMLGGKRTTNHMCMAELLHASKRWVMTGTPTPNMFNSDDLRHLHGLLCFLRERPYGESNAKAWTKAITKPFEANDREGYVRLLRLLKRIMLRHTKASILKQIPAPTCHVVVVDPTPSEYAAYNGIVTGIRINLVTNRNDPSDPNSDELNRNSLMHIANRGHVRNAIRNLRNATCGGGNVQVTLWEEHYEETIAMLRSRGVNSDRVAEVQAFLKRAVGLNIRCRCPLCERIFHALVLIPCGHFVCADCANTRFARHGLSCGVCQASFEWTAFQEIQPGFELMIKEEVWRYNGEAIFVKPRRQKKADGPPPPKSKRKRREFVPIDHSKFSNVSTSKTYYVTRRIAGLLDEFDAVETRNLRAGRYYWDDDSAERPRVPKVIVFSQLTDSIYKLKIALAQHGILSEDFLAGVSAAARTAALIAFRNDPNSNVLLLSDAGSHGLDLSFVTHIFFMEEVMDESLEKQVIARAHRMGAQHSVIVEKVLMRGSLEEYLHGSRKAKRHQGGQQQANEHESEGFYRSLLRNLRTIDAAEMAPFGLLRFQVKGEDGVLVRADTVRLPNPGNPPPEPVVSSFVVQRRGLAIQSQRNTTEHASAPAVARTQARPPIPRQQARPPLAAETQERSQQRPVAVASEPRVSTAPQIVQERPQWQSVAAEVEVPVVVREVKVKEEKVRVKSEPKASNGKAKRDSKRQAAPVLIDLTSDTDESDAGDKPIEIIDSDDDKVEDQDDGQDEDLDDDQDDDKVEDHDEDQDEDQDEGQDDEYAYDDSETDTDDEWIPILKQEAMENERRRRKVKVERIDV